MGYGYKRARRGMSYKRRRSFGRRASYRRYKKRYPRRVNSFARVGASVRTSRGRKRGYFESARRWLNKQLNDAKRAKIEELRLRDAVSQSVPIYNAINAAASGDYAGAVGHVASYLSGGDMPPSLPGPE